MLCRVLRRLPRGAQPDREIGDVVDASGIRNMPALIRMGYFEPVDEKATARPRSRKPRRSKGK